MLTYRDAQTQLDDCIKGIEHSEEIARSQGHGLEGRHYGKFTGQFFGQKETVGLLNIRSWTKAKCQKTIQSIIHVLILIVIRQYRCC